MMACDAFSIPLKQTYKGGVMKISQKLVKNLKKHNVRLRASLLLYKVLLLEFFARNVWDLITYDKRLALGTNNQIFLYVDKWFSFLPIIYLVFSLTMDSFKKQNKRVEVAENANSNLIFRSFLTNLAI